MIKFLLCSPSPRDIPTVHDELVKCDDDILWAKYYLEKQAYSLMRGYFLAHKEYTHMVICPDDLIVTKSKVEQLKSDLESKDYPILSGVCNVDLDRNHDKLSITENLPHPCRPLKKDGKFTRYGWRWYQWYKVDHKFESPIIRVPHSGFALQAIRRDVVENLEFIDDIAYNEGVGGGSSVDVMFSNACEHANIPIMVDTRIQMVHLRKFGPLDITLGDGELRLRKDGKIYTFKEKITP